MLLLIGGGAALLVGGTTIEMNERMTLGLLVLGALMLAPGALGAAFVVPAMWFGWRNQPQQEICWVPLPPGQPATLTFQARHARYHGIWLCADIRHPFGGEARAVVTTIEGRAAEGHELSSQVATCWGFPGDATGATHMFVNDRRPRYGEHTPSLVEFDRIVQARPTGRFRALSLLQRWDRLPPGSDVTLQLVAEPPPDATEVHLHAFVALPR
ncbi:MAG: hypothetical protein JRI55_06260 [Deltaproteobacteria bacterium]|nr:hypothetical protein [Deltaproteobacteria bacterium]